MWYTKKYHLIALFSGLLSAVFMWLYLSSLDRSQPIVVATTFIPKYEVLRSEMLKVVNAPLSPWGKLFIHDTDSAIGKIALVDLQAGEPLFRSRLASADDWFRIRYDLAPQERAFFIPLQPERFPIGVVSGGDRIDIIAVNRQDEFHTATVAMQGIRVIMANPEGERIARLAEENRVSSARPYRNAESFYTGNQPFGNRLSNCTGLVVAVTHDEATALTEFLENGEIYVVLAGTNGIPVH
ncbi:MAG TPA: hypothetical protein GX507_11175 [Clostridia bacterium]|nr:hypothetical protein [Clostridia bacterium]